MELLEMILITASLCILLCFSITVMIGALQSAYYDRKRELRERAQAKRDAEYHANRMKLN